MKPKIYYWSLWVLRLFMVLAVSAALPIVAHGQATVITPQTANQTIFSNQTTTAVVQIKDFGQNVHFLTYYSTTADCMMNIRFQASYDNSVFFPISEDGADSREFPQAIGGGGAFPGLVAYGWFPIMQVLLEIPANVAGNNCHVTAQYSGTSTADSTIQQGFIQSNGYRKLVALAQPPAGIVTQVPATYGSTAGRIYAVCDIACGTAQIVITPVSIPAGSFANAPSSTGPVLQTITLANVNTIQTFDITPVPTESVFVSMQTTPGSADWVTIYYQFLPENDIGNTINVNCITGCSGGGTGNSIVWGPNAIGSAPTEPPIQVGGLQPNGSVAEIQTDALGNTQVVGGFPPGTLIGGTNPVYAGAESLPSHELEPLTEDPSQNLNVNLAAVSAPTVPNTPLGNVNLGTSVTGTECLPSSPVVAYGAVSVTINVSGTWSGGTVLIQDGFTGSTLTLYPILPTGSIPGSPVTTISANGNWVTYPTGGQIAIQACSAGITGTATVAMRGSSTTNAQYVLQPTAGNLNATVICASGCLPSGGSNIVWGPNAVGVAPTEPPVLGGGINPSGNVEVVKTDATGNTQIVGPNATGTVGPTGNPVLGAGLEGITLEPLQLDSEKNLLVDVATVIENRPIGFTANAGAGIMTGTECLPTSPFNILGADAYAINVTGTWVGSITVQGTIFTGSAYEPIEIFPFLTGSGNGMAPGLPISAITANGNYIFYPSGLLTVQFCSVLSSGSATVQGNATTTPNAMYALQPIAANLHARTEPNNAPSSACTPVPINFSSSGNNTIVAGVGGQQVRIYALNVVFGGAATVTFEDGASTALTGPMGIFSGGSINVANTGAPQFITSTGNAFNINLSAGVQGSGWGCYSQF